MVEKVEIGTATLYQEWLDAECDRIAALSPLTPTGEALAALPWTEKERACIAELMALQDLSEFALIRQAMRTYQLVTMARHREGLTMGFYDGAGNRVEYPSSGLLPPDAKA